MESDGASARVSYVYTYSYSGGRSASGSCRVSLTVEWESGSWQITDYLALDDADGKGAHLFPARPKQPHHLSRPEFHWRRFPLSNGLSASL